LAKKVYAIEGLVYAIDSGSTSLPWMNKKRGRTTSYLRKCFKVSYFLQVTSLDDTCSSTHMEGNPKQIETSINDLQLPVRKATNFVRNPAFGHHYEM